MHARETGVERTRDAEKALGKTEDQSKDGGRCKR